MRGALTVAIVVSSAAVALPANAQWLNRPTPSIPRTSDGKPNLAAPAPRAADGHIDPGAFAKPWTMTYTLEFQADTEMIESVCEERRCWIGHLSEVERSAVTVAPQT